MVYTVSVLTNTNILTMNHCLALILGMSIKHTIMIFFGSITAHRECTVY